jgi:methionyl aminopeptidase
MALIKTEAQVALMAEAGRILAKTLKFLEAQVKEGMTLLELDRLARETIIAEGGKPAFLGYKPYGAKHPYPATLCTSLNEVVVHGTPSERVLTAGDILKIDLGVKYRGYYADSAITVAVGNAGATALRLISTTEEALRRAIAKATPKYTIGDIGHAVASYVRAQGFEVVQGLTGHGIGTKLHEDPSVFNEGVPGTGLPLQAGMVLAIEVMTSAGSPRIKQLPDDSYATSDGSISAHFEHTVAVTKTQPHLLTL